jgi:uncharacterized membrane protein
MNNLRKLSAVYQVKGIFMHWFIFAAITAVALAAADVFSKLAADRISIALGVFIYGCCTFTVSLVWFLWQSYNGVPLMIKPGGILSAVGVGLSFTTVTFGLYATFRAGVPISIGSPAIRVTGLLLASMVGILLLNEPITIRKAGGILLAAVGIFLIATSA